MNTVSKLKFPFLVLAAAFLSTSCSKSDRVIVCFRAPYFPVFIKPDNPSVAFDQLRMHIIDKNTGDTGQTIYLKNKFIVTKLEDGQTLYQYKVNENEMFFSDVNPASQQYFVFDDNTGKADTIANYTWTTTKPKNGCYVFTDLSITVNSKQYNPTETNVLLFE